MNDKAHVEIERLLSQARQLRWSDYHRVIELGEQALVIAREADNPLWIVNSLNYIGWAYNRLDSPIQSLKYAKEAVSIAKEHDFIKEYGYALVNLHFCYQGVGESDETLQMLEQVIAIAQQNDFHELLVFGYHGLSVRYMNTLDYDGGIDLLRKALSIIDDKALDVPKTFFYLNIASAYIEMGKMDNGLETAMLSYEDAVENNVPVAKIYSQHMMGQAYLITGDLEQALYHAEMTHELSTQYAYDQHHSLFILGRVYDEFGRYDEALKLYFEAHDILIQNLADMMPELYECIARVYEKKEDYQQALHYLQLSVDANTRNSQSDTEKRVTILKTLYELDVAKREAEFQQAQNLLIQAEMEERLKRQRVEISLEKQLELMKIKNHVLTRLNHEFRTPVTILQTSFELLTRYSDRLTPDKKLEHTQRISEQFQHIKDLLSDVLDVLQVNEPQRKNISIMPIVIDEFITSAIALAEKRTRTSNRIQIINNAPPIIYQNEDLLQQIIVNLLTNAIKFSQDVVLFEVATVLNDSLIIKVKDHGIGIPSDEQEAVFEVLTRGSNLDEIGGNGMGLALVKQSVELLEGEIILNSELNVGTEFTVLIPLKQPYTANNPEKPAYP